MTSRFIWSAKNFSTRPRTCIKKEHSTSMCTLSLKEVARYYTARQGQVYCCMIDATKAFDRIRYDKLFTLLIQRGMPMCIIRLLIDMYKRQRVRTTWDGDMSNQFNTTNGVRQGGVLSPLLFSVYIDVLLTVLKNLILAMNILEPSVRPMT